MPEEEKPIEEEPSLKGRPRKFDGKYDTYDERAVRKLKREEIVYRIAALGGSQADCAHAAGISQRAVSGTYKQIYEEAKSSFKMKIRVALSNKAFEGDSALLRHLGISYCEEQHRVGEAPLPAETYQAAVEYMANKKHEKTDKIIPLPTEEDEDK